MNRSAEVPPGRRFSPTIAMRVGRRRRGLRAEADCRHRTFDQKHAGGTWVSRALAERNERPRARDHRDGGDSDKEPPSMRELLHRIRDVDVGPGRRKGRRVAGALAGRRIGAANAPRRAKRESLRFSPFLVEGREFGRLERGGLAGSLSRAAAPASIFAASSAGIPRTRRRSCANSGHPCVGLGVFGERLLQHVAEARRDIGSRFLDGRRYVLEHAPRRRRDVFRKKLVLAREDLV